MLSISCFHTPQLTYNKGNTCMDFTIYYEAFPQHLWDILTIEHADLVTMVTTTISYYFKLTKFLNRSSLSE